MQALADPQTASVTKLLPLAGADVVVGISGNPQGMAIICLHAVGHDRRDFAELAAALGRDFQFILVDWPGHGESPPDKSPTNAIRYGQIVMALLKHFETSPVILLGNSIGGAAALQAAALMPEKVAGLVLCDTGGLVEINLLVRRISAFMSWFFSAGARGARWFSWAYGLYYHQVLRTKAAQARRAAIIAQGPRCARELADAWASFGKPSADLRHLVPQINCPVWIAWAQGDRVIPWAFVQKAIAGFKNSTTTFFDGGHSAFIEDPQNFILHFRAWADRISARNG
jgi:4,5:9,10-diseco-3-hydroxy-5,9,17-trioxoandrosta-1(10),2-diene-4-oate hydrolase